MIARVFPRKTAASPTDPLAFFGAPTIENIADCIKAGIEAVHISVTFTWIWSVQRNYTTHGRFSAFRWRSAVRRSMTAWEASHRDCI